MDTETTKAPAKTAVIKKAPRNLMCALDDAELLTRGEELVKLMEKQDEQERRKKDATASVKWLEERIAEKQEAVLHKQELRDIECLTIAHYDTGDADVTRTDTDVVIYTRRLTRDELTPALIEVTPEEEETPEEDGETKPDKEGKGNVFAPE